MKPKDPVKYIKRETSFDSRYGIVGPKSPEDDPESRGRTEVLWCNGATGWYKDDEIEYCPYEERV